MTVEVKPFFCGKDCGGDACPLLATVEEGCVTRITNNPAAGKFIKGCARGFRQTLIQNSPDRILTPLIQTGQRGSGQFREVSWDEALHYTAEKLGEVRTKYGANSVLNLGSGGGIGALHTTGVLLSRFLANFGGYTQLKGNYSNGAARFILPYLLGNRWNEAGFDPATMQYAQMIVLWGANIIETRLGSEIPQRLMEAKQRGTQIVVIDPRRTPTVDKASTWWIRCRPGTDAALMLAVLYVWLTEGQVERGFIETHSVGFEQLEAYVLGRDGGEVHSPQWAEPICGVPAVEIERFAREYALAKPAMLLPGYSTQRVFAGEEAYRLTVALQVASGNFGRLGGSTGALNSRLPVPRVGTLPVPALPDLPSVPVTRWPDVILKGKSGGYAADIHAAYAVGSNFVNQGCDAHKSIEAFLALDFSVCHELFMTPTARYCDVVLPAASPFEKEDIGLPWLGNYLVYKPQILPLAGQARNDYDIFCGLAERLGFLPEFSGGRSAAEWIQLFLDQSEVPDQQQFRETGVYLAAEQERTGLADFAADPQRYPLSTPSGMVEIASLRYQEDTGFPAIPTWQAPPVDQRYPLSLITPKSKEYTHSQGSIFPEVRQRARHGLSLHRQDALARGITDGDRVRVWNEQGVTHVSAFISDDLMPGVVCLPEGMWIELNEAGEDVGGSANLLTSTDGTSPGVACIMHGIPVEVEKE